MPHPKVDIGDTVRMGTGLYTVQDITVTIRIKSGDVSYTYLLGNATTGDAYTWVHGDEFTALSGNTLSVVQHAIREYRRLEA